MSDSEEGTINDINHTKRTIEGMVNSLFTNFNSAIEFKYTNNGERFEIVSIANENLRSAAVEIIENSDLRLFFTR